MLKVVFGFLFIGVVSLVVSLIKKKSGKAPVDFPYQSKEVLCSPAERSFLGALEKVVGNGYQIFAKVRLADIVEVNQGLSSSARQSAFNRISRKHLDFVICNARDLSIVGAIEGGMGSSLLLTHDREKSIQHGNLYNTKSFKA